MFTCPVNKFAASLDAEDYDAAVTCLADSCKYESPYGTLIGPPAIVDSYKANGDAGRERFDAVKYRHDVSCLGDGWHQIEFIDELYSGHRSHVFRCHQRVRVEHGKIVQIIHEEIPRQRELLDAFLKECR